VDNINYDLIGTIFISIMATKFVWDFQGWAEKWISRAERKYKSYLTK